MSNDKLKKKKERNKIIDKILEGIAKNNLIIIGMALILAIIFPIVFKSQYLINIAINCLMYSVLALSLNLITGFMGITSLGHAGFLGVGAYTAAILSTRFGIGFISTFIVATIVATIFGIFLGLPTLRIKGRYLAIVTLGFCEIMRIIELNWMSLTRGPMGISGIPRMSLFGYVFNKPIHKYYIVLILLIISIYIINSIMNSRIGRAISSIRDDEIAANAMGVNVFKYKIMGFAISAGLAGLAGAFYAHYMGFIDPNAFTFDQSILILSMTIIGGMASIPGSIFGASFLSILPEVLRGIADYRQIVYGLLLAATMVLRPSGLLGGYNTKHIRQRLEFNDSKNNNYDKGGM